MLKHFILALFLGFIIFFSYLAWFVGFFKPVQIQENGQSEFILIGLPHEGPYHQIISKIQEVEAWVKDQGGTCSKSFGLYLDNPALVEESRLTSLGGCLYLKGDKNLELGFPSHFEKKEYGPFLFVKARFEGSPGIGPFTVYPKVSKYIKSNNLESLESVLEVYEIINQKDVVTEYYFPIKQDKK